MDDEQHEPRSNSAAGSIGVIASVLTITGVLIYGICYYALLNFYEAFQLTPDDIGLDKGSIIATAAISLLAILIVVLPLLSLLAWLLRGLARRRSNDAALDKMDTRVWLTCYFASAVLFELGALVLLVPGTPYRIILLVIVAVVGFILTDRHINKAVAQYRSESDSNAHRTISPARIILGAWLVFLLAALPFIILGEEKGNSLWERGDITILDNIPSRAVLGHVRCVQLTWTGAKDSRPAALPDRHPVLRLGSRQGVLVIVDMNPETGDGPVLYEVPLGVVLVSDIHDAAGCKA